MTTVTTFKNLNVDELWVGGKLFTKENFKGTAGETATIDSTLAKGDTGNNWDLLYDFIPITTPAAGQDMIYRLPNQQAKDERYPILNADNTPVLDAEGLPTFQMYFKTMLYILPGSEWNTGATITVMDVKDRVMGRFYSQSQSMKLVNVQDLWVVC
jgi:hypothetical protein